MAGADEQGRRWDAATGIGFVVLVSVGLLLPGVPPKADASINEIRSFFAHRGAILASDFLIGLGWALFLWFLGSVRSYLRAGEGSEGQLSAAPFGGGVAGGRA